MCCRIACLYGAHSWLAIWLSQNVVRGSLGMQAGLRTLCQRTYVSTYAHAWCLSFSLPGSTSVENVLRNVEALQLPV